MSRRFPLPLSLVAIAAALLPASAGAAVTRDGTTWLPTSGAELLEAVDEINDLTPGADPPTARIQLADGYYVIERPIQLLGHYPVEITGEPQTTYVANDYYTPVTLLETVDREDPWPAVVDGVNFLLQGNASEPYPVVDVGAGVTLRATRVSVGAGTSFATGVQMRAGSVAEGLSVYSDATTPALRMEPGAAVSRIDLTGGEPTLQIADGPGPLRSVQVQGGRMTGGGNTERVVTIAGSDTEIDTTLSDLDVIATDASSTLIDAAGPVGAASGSGSRLTLRGITLDAGLSTTAGIRVTRGVAGSANAVEIEGLLSLGTSPAVRCAPDGAAPLAVRIRGVYREGRLVPGAGCTISETGRRTGALDLVDRANDDFTPRWGSPLIDGAPQSPGLDARGRPRPSDNGAAAADAWTRDIGANEYQYTPPEIDGVAADASGNRGLVRLEATASDTDPSEDALYGLSYSWRFGDGTVLTGQTVEHRFATPTDVFDLADWQPAVELTVTDASGARARKTVTVRPWIAECEVATDSAAYTRGEYCPIIVPTPAPTVAPEPTNAPLAEPVVTPAPTPSPTPAGPALVTSFDVLRGRASLKSSRSTALAASRPSDASVRIGLGQPARITLTVARRAGGKTRAVRGAKLSFTAPAGRRVLRITPRVGRAELDRGVYVVTIAVAPQSGKAPSVTRDFSLRIVR